MARQASSKPDSGSSSTATLGFGSQLGLFVIRISSFFIATAPSCVVRCLVEMLAPYKGRIHDPACGSGGMFVQSEKLVESHGGKLGDISIYGQDKWALRQRPFGQIKRARWARLRAQQPNKATPPPAASP